MSRPVRRPVVVLLVVLLVLAAGAVSRPAPARAQTTFSNPEPIPIPTGPDQADFYPSPIEVSGLAGVITDVNVTLTGWSHTFSADLDILLVGPTGQSALLWSDALAGNDIVDATVTFDDAAPPPSIPLVTGSVRTSYNGGFDPFPGAAPGAPYGVLLAGFNGSDPNGTWNLFVADDLAGDGGAISGGWSLTLTTAPAVTGVATTLSNAGAITIADNAAATPSPIAVSGLSGVVTDVDVMLSGLSHTWPLDLDILLVGPGGQHVMLMSDLGALGGDNDINNLMLTFDDQATAAMLALPLTSGTYQPTNVADGGQLVDPLPASAPAGPHGTNLSVFNGSDPNGTWTLFVNDDLAGDTGTLSGGWSLTLTTASADTTPPTITVPADITVAATGPTGAVVTYSASATDDVDGPLTPTCTPVSGSTFPLGTTTVTCTATDAAGNEGTASFTVTVADTTAPVISVPATITVLATSPAGAVVSYSASATDAIDGAVPVTCEPPSGSTFPLGTTTVTCTATDSAGNVGTASFQVVVGGPVLSQLSPNRVALTSTPQSLTLRGHNFVAGATVTIGQRTYAATFVSSTELRVSVVPKDVFVYGWLVVPTATVRVTNPGGATSNSLALYLAW